MSKENPTIIVGHLNDAELKKSIDELVAHVETSTQKMVDSFNTSINSIKSKLNELGSVKVDMGGTADGGSSRRTSAVEKETKARKELNTTLEQWAADMQKASRLPSEMRTPDMAKSARDSFAAFYKGFNEQARQIEPLIKSWESLLQARHNNGIEQVAQQIRNVRHEIAEIIKKQAELSRTKPQGYMDAIAKMNPQIKALREQIVALEAEEKRLKAVDPFKDNPYLNTLREKLYAVNNAMRETESTSRQWTQATNQLTEAQRKAVEEQTKLFYARTMKLPSDQYDMQIVKLERIQSLLERYRRGEVSFTPAQVSGLEKEERTLLSLIGSVNTARSQSVHATQQEAQAQQQVNRAIKEGVENIKELAREARGDISRYGFANITNYRGVVYAENDERAKGLTIEQQIEKIINQENEARNRAVQTTKAQVEAEQQVAQEKEKQVKSFVYQLESANALNAKLKELKDKYNNMTWGERMSANGKRIAQQIREISRQTQILSSELNRPTRKEVMGLSANTLDEISYKMRQLQNYMRGLNVDTQNAQIREAVKEYDNLKKKMDEVMRKNQEMIEHNTALGRSWNYMKNRLAFYFTVGATTNFIKQLIDIRGQYELLERSIGILIDSAQNGSQIFAELNAMAIKSPFTTMELGAAAKQLVAYDVAAKDVVDTTRRLADMAAAVGIPIERLTYALGQIKAYGYLNARDARMFANAGIPLVKELADYYTELEGRLVSTADIYDRIKKKSIDYTDVMQVVNKMTDEGGKFFNFQEKAADTLKVRIANLTLAWNNMLNEMGKDSQGVLTDALVGMRILFEHWRDIVNLISSAAINFAAFKALQIAGLTLISMRLKTNLALWTAMEIAIRKSLGAAALNFIRNIGSAIASLANPIVLTTVALTAFSIGITKAYMDYRDLIAANEAFNKSIVDNAEENVKSIDKFFEEYRRQFAQLGSMSDVDKGKMWERLQEEIEKTTKNAAEYLNVLNNISDTGERISAGKAILEQSQEIDKEVRRLGERGLFDVGGGFMNDALADDIKDYQDALNDIINKYGDVKKASEANSYSARKMLADFSTSEKEIESELDAFTGKLGEANLDKIMGADEDMEMRLANIREFVSIVRDNFLATEKGQKITSEGRALLNKQLDAWIAKQGIANGLIDNERAKVEENRSAWEVFFDQLNSKDKERLDYLIKTNQTGSDDFKKIWDKAAKEMAERATTSYSLIQDQIANLRNTPDIVINVVYRPTEEKLDEQQRAFTDRFINPKGGNSMPEEEYFKKRKENVEKYGRYMKKENEDNVEWEKRLGEEYQKNAKDIETLNSQLANSAKLSDVDRAAKEKDLKILTRSQEALKEIRESQNFNFDQFGKGGKGGGSKKDVLGDALTKEVQLISDVQKRFKEYKQIGVDAQTAIAKATEEYGNTIIKNNATLRKYGVQTLSSEELAALPLQKVRDFYQEQIKVANAFNNTKGVEALEKALANINVEITKIDYKKITDGLNNELGKLKDEYELAVELDANPEMGDMFLDLFDIDQNALPRTIDQYAERVLGALNKSFEQRKIDFRLPTLDLTRDDIETYRAQVVDGVLDQATFDEIEKKYKEINDLREKDAKDTLKKTQELQYKLSDVDGKIAIETEKLERLRQKLAEETHEEKRKLLELEIKEQEQVIAKLQEDILQMLPTYKALFGGIAEHSAAMTRKIALELRKMLETATLNSDGSYTVTDPQGGTAPINRRTREAQLDKVNKEILKTQSSFQKIKESLTKGEDKMVDWAHALELVGDEANKAADGLKTIGEIFAALGASDDTVEAINDVANTLEGLSQAGQGVAQIYSGDFIGGTVNVIKGTWKAISTWLDNSDKKITRNIESSKRAVRRLQNAYEELEYAVEKSMGAAEIGARRAAIENKKLQLAELERQLQLEKSRKKKKQDEDAIIQLEGEVASAKRELKDLTDGVVEMLTGSDIKGAAEAFVDAWVQAWRAGENTLDAMNEKMDEMIQNLVKKGVTNRIVGTLLAPLYKEIDKFSSEDSEGGESLTINELRKIAQDAGVTAEEINIALGEFYGNLERLGILPKTLEANKQLSALQQGIQGITEDTAGALEAYMNNVSQQMYLHTDILTQIRDAVVGFNFDAQLGTISQILLQLQYSYQTQMAIHGILEGVLTPSGRAFTVELAS